MYFSKRTDFLKLLILIFFISILILQAKSQSLSSCGPLYPPLHGSFSCSRGSKFGSKCTLSCLPGFIDSRLETNDGNPSTRTCFCENKICSWIGVEFECIEFVCPKPDFTNGIVKVVDQWKDGMNVVIEFLDIPIPIKNGWSINLFFSPPLGVNAKITSWSGVLSSSTFGNEGLTFVNVLENKDISQGLTKSYIRTSFVAERTDEYEFRKVYVGLYSSRIISLNCYVPNFNTMKILKKLEIIGEAISTTTQPSTTNILKTLASTLASKSETVTHVDYKSVENNNVTEKNKVDILKVNTLLEKEKIKLKENIKVEVNNKIEKEGNEKEIKETSTENKPETKQLLNKDGKLLSKKVNGKNCKLQLKGAYNIQRGWKEAGNSYYSILVKVPVTQTTPDWTIAVVFGSPVSFIEVWSATLDGNQFNGKLWKFKGKSWNRNLQKGQFEISFNAKFTGVMPFQPNGRVYLCSRILLTGDPIHEFSEKFMFLDGYSDQHVNKQEPSEKDENEENSSTTDNDKPKQKDKTSSATTVKQLKNYNSARCKSIVNGRIPKSPKQTKPKWKPTLNLKANDPDYNEILHKSILFYDAQRAGKTPNDNKILWRGDSTLRDGCDSGTDLSGGWFDAGDTVKFTFPMAASLTNLMWGGIEYEEAYKESGSYTHLLQSLRGATTWLIRAHKKRYELVVMVGDPKKDHGYWGRPEELKMHRPVYKITPRYPGSEVAAESAASLAASSILFRKPYKKLASAALAHAKGLYDFANKFRGNYHDSVPLVKDFYKSWSGYEDELIWAAAWLYKATNSSFYLDEARKHYIKVRGQYLSEKEVSWDRKMISAQVLLADLTGDKIFRDPISRFMNNVMKMPKTAEGIMYLNEWAPNRYAANAAMIAIMASKLNPPLANSQQYFEWGKDQIHRILGLEGGRSYIIGYGKNYPLRPHHRSSSCSLPPNECNWAAIENKGPNPLILYGALVGGPGLNGKFKDDRRDYRQNEVALDYNAGFQTAVAGLKWKSLKKN